MGVSNRKTTDTTAVPDGLERGRGHYAERPSGIPPRGWKDIASRVRKQAKEDHISLVSAGVAFYGFLALFPALIAAISVYGFLTDPADLERHLADLFSILPTAVHDMLSEEMRQITGRPDTALGWSALVGVLISLWSANKGTKALFEGLNIAYDETNSRGFFAENLLSLAFTLGVAVLAVAAVLLVVVLTAVGEKLGLGRAVQLALEIGRWPLLACLLLAGLAVLYKVAPVRANPAFRWVTVGSVVAVILWMLGSVAFSIYVDNFGSYDETYGSVAAVVIFLLWLYLSALIVLLGAEINSEMEHQTAVDSTTGPDKPMGERGAFHADNVAGGGVSGART